MRSRIGWGGDFVFLHTLKDREVGCGIAYAEFCCLHLTLSHSFEFLR